MNFRLRPHRRSSRALYVLLVSEIGVQLAVFYASLKVWLLPRDQTLKFSHETVMGLHSLFPLSHGFTNAWISGLSALVACGPSLTSVLYSPTHA